MFKRIAGLVGLVVCAAPLAMAQLVVTSATPDGSTIKGEHRVRVTVQSQSLVSQVEFYVGDKLVATDESTPYDFVIDTLMYDDGPLTIAAAVYNAGGESKRLVLNLKVDNGLALGVEHHVEIADQMMVEQKWDEAISAARVALKVDASDNSARLAMARAYYGKGIFDLAQKFAEDILASDSANVDARELLSGISLKQAFRAIETSSNRERTIEIVSSALNSAATARRNALTGRIDAFGTVTDANKMSFVDTLMRGGRFSLVIDQLTPLFNQDENDSPVTNRLIYAQIRAGRMEEARRNMIRHVRRGEPDAYGYALKAVLDNWFGDDAAAADAEREALLSDPSDMGVRTAQAFLALRRGRIPTFAAITTSLAESAGESAVTNYYLTSLRYLQNDFDGSKAAFETGLLADPANYHIYIERFNQSISYLYSSAPTGDDRTYQLNFARAFANGAIAAKPESFEALTALALLAMIEGKTDDAVKFGQAAVAAGPQYGAAHYALAGAYFAANMGQQGNASMREAAKYDRFLDGIRAPNTEEAWRYFYRYGRTPLLVSPAYVTG